MFKKLNKNEVMEILTRDIFDNFKKALNHPTMVLEFNYNGYKYRNNGQGVIIRKENEYLFDICLHKSLFDMTYEEFLNKIN